MRGARRLLSLVLAVHPLGGRAFAQVFLTQEQALDLAFPGADRIAERVLALDDEQRAAVAMATGLAQPTRLFKVWIGRRAGRMLGYAVIDEVRGKAQPITYLVVTDQDLVVQRIEIIAYREAHGWEVKREAWRKQFVGARPTSVLRIGRDIHNIAGATISCRAITEGVRRNLAYLDALVTDLARADSGALPAPLQPPAGEGSRAADAGAPLRRQRLLMGTTLEIALLSPDASAAEAAFAEVARLEAILSGWRRDSALSQINREAGLPPRPRDAALIAFLARCDEISRRTGGALDVTVGPLVVLWREAAERGERPTAAALAAARASTGDGVLLLDVARGTAGLRVPGAALDPDAVDKGYALDAAAAVLRQHGVTAALLDFGGQMLAVGAADGGDKNVAWPIDLRGPRGEMPGEPLLLRRGSLATTADYERRLVVEGVRCSHVVDPRTGEPVADMAAVTVHADSATDADGLSTALFAMGFDRAARWAHEHDTAARLVAADGRVVTTTAFEHLRAKGRSR